MKPSTLIVIIVVLLIPVVAFFATRSSNNSSMSTTPTPSASPTASASGYADPQDTVSATQVVLKTDKGNITLNLFPDIAPMSVKNFVTLGKRGYYNGTYFHRIMADFMIQGGDPTGTGSGGQSIWAKGFPLELGNKKFVKGTLGMARSSDPNSNGSQFFIVTKTNQPGLDGQYTVFGQVADDASQSVVDAIAATPVTVNPQSGEDSVPTVQIHITGFDIIQ